MKRPSFVKALSRIQPAILEILEKEHTKEGLLHDVDEIYLGDKQLQGVDYPAIWIVEDRVFLESIGVGNQSEMYVARYNFFAIDYDSEDPTEGQMKSRNLALRIGKTLEKGWRLTNIDNDNPSRGKLFDNMKFQELLVTGEDPNGASNSINMSVIVYDFKLRAIRFCG